MIILGKKIVGRKETLEYANKSFNWPDGIIGISCYYGFWAWLLARLTGRKCIYYAIDFYTYRVQKDFLDGIVIWLAMQMDKFLCHYVDMVWDISERINYGRIELGHYILYRDILPNVIGEPVNMKDYGTPSIVVPLSYPPSYFRYSNKYRPNIIFVGIDPYGKDVWPEDVEWIGKGDVPINELLDTISKSGIGISVWDKYGNNYFGDPGKTKLYSACGIPVIMTKNTPYAEIIEKTQSGIIVKYDKESIRSAAREIFKNYSFYKNNVKKTWEYINADNVFRNIKILG